MANSSGNFLGLPSGAPPGKSQTSVRPKLHFQYGPKKVKKQMSTIGEEDDSTQRDRPASSLTRSPGLSVPIPPTINIISASQSPNSSSRLYEEYDVPKKPLLASSSPSFSTSTSSYKPETVVPNYYSPSYESSPKHYGTTNHNREGRTTNVIETSSRPSSYVAPSYTPYKTDYRYEETKPVQNNLYTSYLPSFTPDPAPAPAAPSPAPYKPYSSNYSYSTSSNLYNDYSSRPFSTYRTVGMENNLSNYHTPLYDAKKDVPTTNRITHDNHAANPILSVEPSKKLPETKPYDYSKERSFYSTQSRGTIEPSVPPAPVVEPEKPSQTVTRPAVNAHTAPQPKPQSLNTQLAVNNQTHRSRTLNVGYSESQRKAIEEAQELMRENVEKRTEEVTKKLENNAIRRNRNREQTMLSETANDDEAEVEKFVQRIKQQIKDRMEHESKNEIGALAGRQTKIAKNVEEVTLVHTAGAVNLEEKIPEKLEICQPIEHENNDDSEIENNNTKLTDSIKETSDHSFSHADFYDDDRCEENELPTKLDVDINEIETEEKEGHTKFYTTSLSAPKSDEHSIEVASTKSSLSDFYDEDRYEETDIALDFNYPEEKDKELDSATMMFVTSLVNNLFESLDEEDLMNHVVSTRLMALKENTEYHNQRTDEYDHYADEPTPIIDLSPTAIQFFTPRNSTE